MKGFAHLLVVLHDALGVLLWFDDTAALGGVTEVPQSHEAVSSPREDNG